MDGRRITLRTLDVGGDKPLDYVPVPPEANPFLGVRGIRLALARPSCSPTSSARSCGSRTTTRSTSCSRWSPARRAHRGAAPLDDAVEAIGRGRPDLRVGIMVEVPAAALKAAAFAPHVDFFSIGTNDLTQYALAAERGNDALAALADPLDPGVLALVAAARRPPPGRATCWSRSAGSSPVTSRPSRCCSAWGSAS